MVSEISFYLAFEAINETAGPSGLSIVLPVFGVLPIMPLKTKNLPRRRERMKAIKDAQSEMIKAMQRSRLSTVRRSNVPVASDSLIEAGEEVLVYRNDRSEWVDPHVVLSVHKKQVQRNVDWTFKHFLID